MRRKDFECRDKVKAYKFLSLQDDGTLSSFNKEGEISIRPMNFVRIEDVIYFHGARRGEKVEGVSQKAVFNVYESHSLIPSYWFHKDDACPATAFFQSIIIKGDYNLVEDLNEKAFALQKMMEKLQPEGKHLALDKEANYYKKQLSRMSVFSLSIESFSYKVKLGQNWSLEKRNLIKDKLLERGQLYDIKSVNLMREFELLN